MAILCCFYMGGKVKHSLRGRISSAVHPVNPHLFRVSGSTLVKYAQLSLVLSRKASEELGLEQQLLARNAVSLQQQMGRPHSAVLYREAMK
ncbi:hypothetical protein AOLI_G00158340 [Acnodon oligacanthus]